VADEVRALATRTGQATTEINQLIEATRTNMNDLIAVLSEGTERVKQGMEHANHSGATLQEIVERSQEAAERVRNITQQVSQQLQIAGTVNSEVETIAKSARDNGDVVVQVVEFSNQLTNQMDELQSIISQFKTA
jgi:methyl-accepting chemotaxis protein